MSAHPDLECFTLPQASELTKRSRRSLERDIAAGRLRAVHLGGNTVIPRIYLEHYIFGNGATVPCDNLNAPAAVERPGAGTGGSSSHAPDTFTNGDAP